MSGVVQVQPSGKDGECIHSAFYIIISHSCTLSVIYLYLTKRIILKKYLFHPKLTLDIDLLDCFHIGYGDLYG